MCSFPLWPTGIAVAFISVSLWGSHRVLSQSLLGTHFSVHLDLQHNIRFGFGVFCLKRDGGGDRWKLDGQKCPPRERSQCRVLREPTTLGKLESVLLVSV